MVIIVSQAMIVITYASHHHVVIERTNGTRPRL
jgi:hypothetical protein